MAQATELKSTDRTGSAILRGAVVQHATALADAGEIRLALHVIGPVALGPDEKSEVLAAKKTESRLGQAAGATG